MKKEFCKNCSSYTSNACKSRGKKDKPKVAFIVEAPKLSESVQGEIISGNNGALIDAVLKQLSIDPSEAYYTSALKCPVKNTPKTYDIEMCRNILFKELEEVKPEVIVAMGVTTMKMLFHETVSITEVRGRPKWSNEFNCYVIPTYQPGAIWKCPDWFPEFAADIKKALKAVSYPAGGIKDPEINTTIYKTLEQKEEVLKKLHLLQNGVEVEDGLIACDIETEGFDYFEDDVLDIGFAATDSDAVIVSRPLLEDPEIQNAIDDLFKYSSSIIGFQNGKFDCGFLKADMDPKVFGKKKKVVIPNARNDFDTMLAHFEIDERSGTHGLKVWAKEYFNAPDWEHDIKKYLPNKDAKYSLIPDEVRHRYLAHDVYYTRMGMKDFDKGLDEEGTRKCFEDVLMPVSNAFTEIELRGVQLDVVRMEEMKKAAEPEIERTRKVLEEEAFKVGWSPDEYVKMKDAEKAEKYRIEKLKNPSKNPPGKTERPKTLNPKSSPQMQWVAYDLCGMPLFEGKKTCSKDAVEQYQYKHPFWKALADYKEMADLFGIYIKGMLQRVDKDNRIRPDFYLTGTVTGRISCHDPNLQNLPRKSIVKDFFVANDSSLECYDPTREETVIVNVDYKTLEVVVAAILSDDKLMQEPFIKGQDYHTNTMKGVFASHLNLLRTYTENSNYSGFIDFCKNSMMMEIRPKVHEMCQEKKNPLDIEAFIVDYLRFLTKFITFGIMYGRKAPSLAYGELQCSVNEAQQYIDNFLMTYKDFWKWQKKSQRQAKEEGYVQTLFGHKRRWHLTTDDTLYKLENQAVNTPIQGSAAQFCLIKIAIMHELLKQNGWGWILFTVHDSIAFEMKKKYLQQSLTWIRDEMENSPFDSNVPFKCDLEVGATYKRVETVIEKDGKWVPKNPDRCSDWLKETLK